MIRTQEGRDCRSFSRAAHEICVARFSFDPKGKPEIECFNASRAHDGSVKA